MNRQPSVLTVILNYKTPELTLRSAACALKAMEGIRGEITIVDNASGDGSCELMKTQVNLREWDRVRVIQAGRNGGYGAGNNFGIMAGMRDGTRPDYIYVLNSDAFPAPDALHHLLAHAEAHPKVAFAGSYIHGEDGEPHLTCFRFPSILGEFEGAARLGPVSRLLQSHAVPMPVPEETRPVDWLAGASLLMRREVLDKVGLFDERFFLYFEETDLCRRVTRAGHEVHFVRPSEVAHIGSVSTGMKHWTRVPGYWFDSRLHYFVKNHGVTYAALATTAHTAGGLMHRLRRGLTGNRAVDPPHFLRTLVLHDLSAVAKAPRRALAQRSARLNGA